jgi:nucleoside-diphosphate-sugar epimerase
MRILVIGGTRFFGKRIVEKLLAQGHAVAVFTRGHNRPAFWDEIEAISGDRRDYRGFREKLASRSFDVVIDNVAFQGGDVESVIETFRSRIGHYLLCSTGSVYSDPPHSRQFWPTYEDDADLTFTGDHPYAEGKRAAELALWSIPEAERPFAFTMLRPTVVDGPDDASGRSWYWIQRVADGRDVLIPHAVPSAILRHAYADDVAEAFVRAAANPVTFYKAYNLAGEDIFTIEDYVRTMAALLGHEPKITVASLERIRQEPGLAEFEAPLADERFVPDISPLRQDLVNPLTSLAVWLERTMAWFLNEYRGGDSQGYAQREAEVAAAKRLQMAGG